MFFMDTFIVLSLLILCNFLNDTESANFPNEGSNGTLLHLLDKISRTEYLQENYVNQSQESQTLSRVKRCGGGGCGGGCGSGGRGCGGGCGSGGGGCGGGCGGGGCGRSGGGCGGGGCGSAVVVQPVKVIKVQAVKVQPVKVVKVMKVRPVKVQQVQVVAQQPSCGCMHCCGK